MAVKRKALKGFDKASILEHLRDIAKSLGQDTLSTRELKKHGDVSPATIHRKFGGFSKALIEAGLKPARIYKRDQGEMVRELAGIMDQLGREPSVTPNQERRKQMTEQPFIIKFDHNEKKSPEDLKESLDSLRQVLGPMKEMAKISAQLKWAQYNELVTAGFSKPQALQLIKDGLKM